MQSGEPSSFLAFKEIANKSLGLRGDDDIELVPLDSVLTRIEDLSRDLSRFDTLIELIQQDELYFRDLGVALDGFRRQIVQTFAISDSKAAMLQCAPVEEVVFTPQGASEARLRFCTAYQHRYQFNEQRGLRLLEFMLAHFMEESTRFKRLNRGMRSRLVPYAKSLESVYSIWEANQFGRVWTLPGNNLPKTAYASANNRLIDGLYSAVDFSATYEIFKKHLNPLEKFPVQFLYNVIMSDPKTIIQEFGQANNIALARYEVRRVSGPDHAPEFYCMMSFGKRTFEGLADNKSHAEAIAARKAVEFLVEDERNRMTLWIAHTISAGMNREEKETTTLKIPPSKLAELRQTAGTSCSYTSLTKCLTLKADVLPYFLPQSATNENLAFCGSWLAMAIAAGKSSDKTGSMLSLREPARDCVQKTRHNVFPRSQGQLSNSQYLDVVQAILYAEFLLRGYAATTEVFDRCILAARKADQTSTAGPFIQTVQYTQLLQEFTQQLGVELPSYHYVLTNPNQN